MNAYRTRADQPDAAYPVADETSILSGREAPVLMALRAEKEFTLLPLSCTEVVINGLPGLLGDLELYRLAVFFWRPLRAQRRIHAAQCPRV